MRVLAPLFLLVTACAAAESRIDQEAEVEAAAKAAATCEPKALSALFALSASGRITGAHTSEDLSKANEDIFLKCPKDFLVALKKEPEANQDKIVGLYFGIAHPPWELGAELRKWKDHAAVGPLVLRRFSAYLDAKEPK